MVRDAAKGLVRMAITALPPIAHCNTKGQWRGRAAAGEYARPKWELLGSGERLSAGSMRKTASFKERGLSGIRLTPSNQSDECPLVWGTGEFLFTCLTAAKKAHG
jgi:hypothetical protein